MKLIHFRTLRLGGSALLLSSLAGLCFEQRAQAGHPAAARAAESAHAASLRFEPNRGQLDEKVRFLTRGKGFGVYLAESRGARLRG